MAKEKLTKTNAMRQLDRAKVAYKASSFPIDLEHLDAVSVANSLNEDPQKVYKTLVLVGSDNNHYVAVIPGPNTLDLKAVAQHFQIKSCQMLPLKELKPLTGYIHGGCSPLAMKKAFKTVIDSSAKDLCYFYVSAGELGKQLKLNPSDLANLISAQFAELCQA